MPTLQIDVGIFSGVLNIRPPEFVAFECFYVGDLTLKEDYSFSSIYHMMCAKMRTCYVSQN